MANGKIFGTPASMDFNLNPNKCNSPKNYSSETKIEIRHKELTHLNSHPIN